MVTPTSVPRQAFPRRADGPTKGPPLLHPGREHPPILFRISRPFVAVHTRSRASLVCGSSTRCTEIVLVNEIVGGAETAGYLLKYDSIHGTW